MGWGLWLGGEEAGWQVRAALPRGNLVGFFLLLLLLQIYDLLTSRASVEWWICRDCGLGAGLWGLEMETG